MEKAKNNLPRHSLGPMLQQYFCKYLIDQRDLSSETVKAYRDTFKLLLRYLEKQCRKKIERLCVADLDAARILKFLDHLERRRNNGPRSRNARLAAIRSFFRYVASVEPMLLPVAQRVLSIPVKRFDRHCLGYLTREQMEGLLDAPNASSRIGLRDRVLLMLMYNTGARVSELAALRVGDLRLESGSIHIRGKGRKQRSVPLWRQTLKLLRQWLKQTESSLEMPLLPNQRGGFMTRAGVTHRLHRAAMIAAKSDRSLHNRTISPHLIRHTTAMHLLQSGVDLSVIAMWLGHESVQTTHQYLEADLESKKKALESVNAPRVARSKKEASNSLIQFLEGL